MKTEDDDDIDFQYDCLLLLIKGRDFRNPIEKFKDFNCIHFFIPINQYYLHKISYLFYLTYFSYYLIILYSFYYFHQKYIH